MGNNMNTQVYIFIPTKFPRQKEFSSEIFFFKENQFLPTYSLHLLAEYKKLEEPIHGIADLIVTTGSDILVCQMNSYYPPNQKRKVRISLM
jgi:hypothetical protein